MKIRFVEVCGFRGFRDKTRFDLSDTFSIVVGRNGVGKSTLCDAIEFALTGHISKYRIEKSGGESAADYFWWRGRSSPTDHYVQLGLTRDDGKEIVIARTREGSVSHSPDDIVDALCVKTACPDEPLDQLTRTTIIRDESITAWSLDLGGHDRFRFVRGAIGAVEGPNYSTRAAAVVTAAEKELERARLSEATTRDALEQALASLSNAQSHAEQDSDLTATINFFETALSKRWPNKSDLLADATKLLEQRRASALSLSTIMDIVQSHYSELQNFEGYRDRYEREKSNLESSQQALTQNAELVAAARRQLEAERDANEFATRYASLLEHGHAIGLQDGHCPLCAARQTEEDFHRSVERARARLSVAGARASKAHETLTSTEQRQRELALHVEENAARFRTVDQRMQELQRVWANASIIFSDNGIASDLNNIPVISKEIERRKEELIETERAVRRLQASSSIERLAAEEAKVTQIRRAADEASQRTVSCEIAAERAEMIRRTITSILGQIVNERLSMISPLLVELYQRLRPHADWRTIDYRLTGDLRRALNLTVGDDLNPQFVFSSGQRRAAGLAFLLAVHLSRPWCRLNTLVLDDPVQHVDDYRALNLVELLSALRGSAKQIIVAVEDTALADLLARRLRSTAESPGRRFDLDQLPNGGGKIVRAVDIRPMARSTLSTPIAG